MVPFYKKFGMFGICLQLLSVATYCFLVAHERAIPGWTTDSVLGTADRHLLATSLYLWLLSAVCAIIGLIVDQRRSVAIITLALALPVMLLMGAIQGIS